MNAKNSLLFFLKGMLMGLADIIPGVSGGTIALITGIYERLVFGIRNIGFRFVPFFLKGEFAKAKKDFLTIDFPFFVPLLSGIFLSFLLLSSVIHLLLLFYPVPTFGFFFGLILASGKVVFTKIKKKNPLILVFLLIGFTFAVFFASINPLQTSHSPTTIFLSGVIAVCAMILPGISGAFILLFLGQYEFMLLALRELNVGIIFFFVSGGILGIIIFSRLLAFLLKRHEGKVMAFLTGLMLGALTIPLQNITDSVQGTGTIIPIFFGLIGVLVVLLLERLAGKKTKYS